MTTYLITNNDTSETFELNERQAAEKFGNVKFNGMLAGLEPGWEVDDISEHYEDDGQPTEYEEWQDFMGGDDWDHGQFDG